MRPFTVCYPLGMDYFDQWCEDNYKDPSGDGVFEEYQEWVHANDTKGF